MDYGEYYKSFDPYPYYEERGWLNGDGRIGGKAKENGKERKPGANPLISALYQIFSISHIAPRG